LKATFCRASLLVQVNGEPQPTDSLALSPGRSSTTRSRILFHEAVHYWQELSHGFLIKLADEEWTRLRTYEEKGEVAGIGPVRREFDWQDPGIGFSARTLHECLARYWEIIAFGPAQVISLEWQLDRTAAHPDFQQAWKEARHSTPENASSSDDVYMAMLMIGGEYAAPFLAAWQQFGPDAAFVFPWLAHLALTTDRPTTSYAMLTNECGHELANEVSEILDDPAIPFTERYDSTMILLGPRAHLAFLRTLPHDSMTGYGLTAYSPSHLRTNPAYAATFDAVVTAASALATTRAGAIDCPAMGLGRGF